MTPYNTTRIRAFLGGLLTLTAAVSITSVPARAQMGGQGMPDLSDFARAISKAVESPASPSKNAAGSLFSTGLTVPSVAPGTTAREIGHQLRESVEKQAGPQPALQKLEAAMPQMLTAVEGALAKNGFAKHDMGVAFAAAFIQLYETANKHEVSVAGSKVAARTLASAVAKTWGPKFTSLEPAAKEKMYETMLIAPTLNDVFATQFGKAGKASEEAGIRQTAGMLFQKLIGVSPSQVTISAEGRITGLAAGGSGGNGGSAKEPQDTAAPSPSASAGGGVSPATIAGVYAYQYNATGVGGFVYVAHEPVIAFKNGTYHRGFDVPLARFDVAREKREHPDYWGKWRGSGKNIEITNEKKQWEKAVWIGPLTGGGRLSGTFSSIGGGGNTAFGGNVVVASIKNFKFYPDGHFNGDSSSMASAPGAVANSGQKNAGTYTISGYTIDLHFADGTVDRRSFARMTDKLVYLNGDTYLVREH